MDGISLKSGLKLFGAIVVILTAAGFVFAGDNTDSEKERLSILKVSKVRAIGDFKYLIYSHKEFDPSVFTIVYLPGGPGGSVSEDYNLNDFNIKRSASDVQYIFIDPPGTGINLEMGEKNSKNISSKFTVAQSMRVLEKEHLSNYAVWGLSYGTLTATMLSHEIEANSKLTLPRALILEGTLGKAYDQSAYFYQGFAARIRDFYSNLPPETYALLREYKQLEKDEGEQQYYLEAMVRYFSYENPPQKFINMNRYLEAILGSLKGISKGPEDPNSQIVDRPVKSYSELRPDEKADFLNAPIKCNELVVINNVMQQKAFANDEGTYRGLRSCIPPVNGPEVYDSIKFQITSTPIIYLQGFNDFQTPLPSALHHYFGQSQLAAGSSFSLILGSNHGVFSNSFEGCLAPFLNDMKSGDLNLASMNACALKNKVEIKKY